MVRRGHYTGEQGSPTVGSGQLLLILELTRKTFVDFGASALFWTVLRAQQELAIHIWRFSGPEISFSKKLLFFLRNIFFGVSF